MATAVDNPDKPSKTRADTGRQVVARLEANPGVTQVKVANAQVYYHLDFLTDAECASLIALIDRHRRPSTLLSETGDPQFRTSESCDMDRFSPLVQPIDERIAGLLGIDPPYGETMQGQRYAPGQQFRAHHDYFHEDQPYWPRMKAEGGQRTWTAMLYLNAVDEGGATWFPQAGIRIPPRKRMLLAWNNMQPDGQPNPFTLHEGVAVTKGTKYVVTKWFREQPWFR
ncbi:prolyl hydroxylase family protein [Sphingomonas sp.]|uniref:prolyl hydroxylase family protein n=1 Tax=Sphingomonas sp. TaxID=28214 RepID=UPI002DD674E1|nr:2OG-Fe(II) oxygenase [Sphingomonas sp.]